MNNDQATIVCPHKDSPETIQVCRHLLHYLDSAVDSDYVNPSWQSHYRRFTGHGLTYFLVCEQCSNQKEIDSHLVSVCNECYDIIQKESYWEGNHHAPEIKVRETNLDFEHRQIQLLGLPQRQLLSLTPIMSSDNPNWLAITSIGELFKLDFGLQQAKSISQLANSGLDFAKDIAIHLASNAQTVAIVNTKGQHGIVFDLSNIRTTIRLHRDNYHPDVSNYPIAFFEHEGRTLLVHGTEWNRLDISDPLTGDLLTPRNPTSYMRGEVRPKHYLDYFHCGLTISSDQKWIVDNGWIWHPRGTIVAWNLQTWITDNVWESEDGQSHKVICWRDYYWDGPLCWIDDKTLVIYGYGTDEENLIPAVRIFNVETGAELRWFPGPHGNLTFDQHLFSYSKEQGTSIWDIETGERLFSAPDFCPTSYHPIAKCFLTVQPDGNFILSRLVENTNIG